MASQCTDLLGSQARKELSEFRTATEKSKHGEQAAMASQNLMLVDGTMICPDVTNDTLVRPLKLTHASALGKDLSGDE